MTPALLLSTILTLLCLLPLALEIVEIKTQSTLIEYESLINTTLSWAADPPPHSVELQLNKAVKVAATDAFWLRATKPGQVFLLIQQRAIPDASIRVTPIYNPMAIVVTRKDPQVKGVYVGYAQLGLYLTLFDTTQLTNACTSQSKNTVNVQVDDKSPSTSVPLSIKPIARGTDIACNALVISAQVAKRVGEDVEQIASPRWTKNTPPPNMDLLV